MKYLKGREKFLSEIKHLNRQQINESFDMSGSQGPFGNDIAWGDSLVGRLINFVIRKIGVGVNMVRIQPVIARLKMEFRNILASSEAAGINEETMKKISMFIIIQQIRIIKFAIVDMKSPGTDEDIEGGEITDISQMGFSDIKNENYLKECEDIIESCMQAMGATVDQYGEIENYDELQKTLKELLEVIKIMKAEIKESKPKEGEAGEEAGEESNSLDNYIDNFSAVAAMVVEYDEMKKKQAEEFKKSGAPTSGQGKMALNNEPEKVEAEKNLVGTETMDSYSYISEAVASPVMAPLKKLYDTLKQLSPEDLITDLNSFIKMTPEAKKADKFAKPISNIYKYIRFKTGIKESSMINEDLNAILSRDKVLGDVILSLYNISKTKPDASFDGLTPNMKEKMALFNSTMPNCLKPESKKEMNIEAQKESKLLKYDGFKDEYINESKIGEFLGWSAAKIAQLFGYGEDEAKDMKEEEVSKIKVNKNNQQKVLSLYWNEIYTSKITKILLTEKEFEALTKELVELKEEPGEGIIINGFDPIIEIVKCFNRAYKLYTVPVIPGGRSSGAVDRATYAEYTSFGSGGSGGQLSAYSGPFRHNKTYNMWENAVLDIMKDREFQPIFDKDTKLRVGNKFKEGAGTILRKFMTDIMDGETLYKSKEDFGKGSGGAQKVLLEKYFGEVPDDIKEADLAFSPNEVKENTELQSKIKTATVQFKAGKTDDIKDAESLKGMIFSVDVDMTKPADYKAEDKDNNKEIDTTKRYFFIQETEGDMLYVVFSRKFGHFVKYVANDYLNRDAKMTVSFNPSNLMTQTQTDLYLTKIKLTDLRKMMAPGGKTTLMGQLQGTTNKVEIGEQKTKSLEFLYTLEDGTEEKIYNLEKLDTDGAKGFKSSELKAHSPQSL